MREKVRMRALLDGKDITNFNYEYDNHGQPINECPIINAKSMYENMLFSDFMFYWIENIEKHDIQIETYGNYYQTITSIIMPYFYEKKILLNEITAFDIQHSIHIL